MSFTVEFDEWIETPKTRENKNVDREMYGLQPFPPLPTFGMSPMSKLRSGHSQGSLEGLDVLFSRYRRVLSLVAYHVLGSHAEAEIAVQNCVRAVSGNVPRFEHEGAFRSWLVRVLMDEAVAILNKTGANRRW
jgi:Sigma-70 region 2